MKLFGTRLSRKPIQGTAKMVHILLVTLIFMLTLFGLFANRYTWRGRQRFVFSKVYLSYAMLISVCFIGTYVRQIYLDLTGSKFDLRDAVKLYSYMNTSVATINFATQMLMSKQVARMMSKVPLFKTLEHLHIDSYAVMKSVVLALIKVLGFPFVIEVALVLQQKRNAPHIHWLWTLYKLFPMIISNFLNNCYFGAMIIAKNIIDALNLRLNITVKQVNYLHHGMDQTIHSEYFRTRRYCTYADEIDGLAIKYNSICTQATKYMALMSLSITLSLICHLVGITVGVFNQYYGIAECIISGKRYDAFGAFINLVFLTISILEVGLLTYVSNDILIATQTTGIILQNVKLQQADWRFRQCTHAFSYLLDTIKYKIKPMGLFEIDISLISSVLSTVASFSLILVQSDLSQRFK